MPWGHIQHAHIHTCSHICAHTHAHKTDAFHCLYVLTVPIHHTCNVAVSSRVFDKNFHSAPNWLKIYMPTVPQSTVMGQSYSISIEGLIILRQNGETGDLRWAI